MVSTGRWCTVVLGLALVIHSVPPLAAAAVSSQGGLGYESEDGAYTFDVGGRVMWDMDSFDGVLNLPNDGDRRFNTRLRRARMELGGEFPGDFAWVFEVNYIDDDEGGDAEVHAAGLSYTGWSVADVFIGRTKEPFGLEELTSSKAISTMRRALIWEATDADNQPHYGIRLDGFVGPLGWSAGAFNPNGNPRTEDGSARVAFTGRLFAAPILTDEAVLHVGAAYTDRNLDESEELPGFRLGVAESADDKPVADLLLTREDRQTGLEALYIHGPFSLQGEYFRRDMKGADGSPDGDLDSQYIMATWTATGEQRGYKREEGIPGIIRPEGPGGAVELVARWEHITFERSEHPTQEARIYLAGVNYYPNRNVKLMLNVTQLETDSVVPDEREDDSLVISGRVQLAF